VVKEEGLVFVRVVEVAEGDGAADIEAEDVHAQFLFLVRSREKVVASIKGVIAVVFPCRAMQPGGPGLKHHGDGAGRREAIVGAVVRSQLAELSHRLAGRGRSYAASATAVVVLTAIYHEDIVGSTL